MLGLFSLAFAFATVHNSYAQTGCPGNTQARLMQCVGPLQTFAQAGPQEKKALCGQARDSLQCVQDAVAECVSIESSPFQQMLQGLSMLEADINSNCNEVPESIETPPPIVETEVVNDITSCSKKDKKTLLRCARKLQRYSTQSPVRCGRVSRAMDCMTTLLEKCRAKIKPRTIKKVESHRQNLMGLCVETNEIDEEDIAVTASPVSEIVTTISPEPVAAECPSDAMNRINECMTPIQSVDPSQGQEAMCRALTGGMDCLDDVIARCSSLPGIDSARPMLEQTRNFVRSKCPKTGSAGETEIQPEVQPEVGVNGECPVDISRQIKDCSRYTDQIGGLSEAETCSAMNEALQCVNDLLELCGHLPEVQALTRVMNLDSIRDIVRDHCSGNPISPPETGGETNDNCPSDYAQQLQTCAAPMQSLSQSPGNVAHACSVASDGLGCMMTILNDCGGKPEVRIIQSTLNMDELKGMLMEQCAPYLGGSNETSVGDDDCPPDYGQKIMDCVEPMESLSELQDVRLMCSEMNGALDCVQGYLNRCSSRPEIQGLTQAMSFDQITTMVQSTCGGDDNSDADSNDSCPSGYLLKMTDCANKMQEFTNSGNTEDKEMACSVARDGFGCVSQIFKNCAHKPEMQSFGDMLDLEEVQKELDKECQPQSEVIMSNDASGNSCTHEEAGSKLLACNRLLNKFNDESLKFKKRCRLVFKGFDCFEDLTTMCPDSEVVTRFTSMVNLDQARGSLKDVCSP